MLLKNGCIPSSNTLVACNDDARDPSTGQWCALYTSTMANVNLNANVQYLVVIGR